jgi:hypothetical protein
MGLAIDFKGILQVRFEILHLFGAVQSAAHFKSAKPHL